MTLATCRKRLELAKTEKEKAFWQARIEHKLTKPKYRNEQPAAPVEQPMVEEKPNAKKSKRH